MDNKISVMAIIVADPDAAVKVNGYLHEYREYIIGRMGVPHTRGDLSVISVVLDAPPEKVNALSGKIGMIDGVSSKVLTAK